MSVPEINDATETFVVGMADLAVVRDQNLLLCTYPLGACLGIAIYDPVTGVSGLLHSMLPDSSIDPKRALARPGMFLDSGLRSLLHKAQALGVESANLLVFVAGGARIMDESASFNIGKRNHDVLLEWLRQHALEIKAEAVGGVANRSLQLYTATGEIRVRTSGLAEDKILCKP